MRILGPHPEEDRGEPVPGEEVVDGAACADGGVVADFHPQAREIVHFPLQDFPGQAILRDAVAQPAAGFRRGLEDHRPVAGQGQVVGAAQTRRPCPDDGHGLIFLRHFRDRQGIPVGLVRREPLESADGHGLVHFLAAAVAFARVRADAADGPGQGQAFHDQLARIRYICRP